MEFPKRKRTRLIDFDYSAPGKYFLTICTKEKAHLLSRIVGADAPGGPFVELTPVGKVVEKHIKNTSKIENVTVEKYVIMPNHIHMILYVEHGAPKASPPTAIVPRTVSVLKRFVNQEVGYSVFQRSYHDHIIRNDADYLNIWTYIDGNPSKWKDDCFYTPSPL